MNLRQRDPEPSPPAAPDPGAAAGGQLPQLAREAAEFAAAAQAIIRSALSQDSQAFLQANRQQGGQ